MTPDGWHSKSLRDLVAEVTTGVSVNSESRPRGAGEIGVLKTSAVTYGVFKPEENKAVLAEEVARSREHPRAGSVLISRMNTPLLVGASAYVPRDHDDLVLPDRIWQLRPGSLTDGRWLHCLLSSPAMRARLSEIASGTSGSMKNISQAKLLGLELAAPPLGEQRKIAAIVSAVDDAIATTLAVNDQLQIVKKAVMAELLTRGLPGRHTRFKQTEIGEVPDSWDVVPLADLVQPDSPITYGVVQPGPVVPNGVLFVRSGDVAEGHLRPETMRTIGNEVSGQYTRTVLRGGELLVALVGQPGATVLVPETLAGANIARQVGLLRLGPRARPAFVRYFLSSDAGTAALRSKTIGSVQQVINLRDLETIRVPVPLESEQAEIAAAIMSFDDRGALEEANHHALRSLKFALMSVLLSGEVRVSPDENAA